MSEAIREPDYLVGPVPAVTHDVVVNLVPPPRAPALARVSPDLSYESSYGAAVALVETVEPGNLDETGGLRRSPPEPPPRPTEVGQAGGAERGDRHPPSAPGIVEETPSSEQTSTTQLCLAGTSAYASATPVEKPSAAKKPKPKKTPKPRSEWEMTEGQKLVEFFVDECRAAGFDPSRSTVGAMASNVAKVHGEGRTPREIALGIRRMVRRGQIKPWLLWMFVDEARSAEAQGRSEKLTAADLLRMAAEL